MPEAASVLSIAPKRLAVGNSIFSNAAPSVLGRTSKLGSRPGSVLVAGGDDDVAADADALSDWGVDKFLSKEAKESIAAGQKSVLKVSQEAKACVLRLSNLPTAMATRKSMDTARVAPQSTPNAAEPTLTLLVLLQLRRGTAGAPDSKLELLARFKLYRERQENLPPSEWDGPGPQATKDEVVEHLIGFVGQQSAQVSSSSFARAGRLRRVDRLRKSLGESRHASSHYFWICPGPPSPIVACQINYLICPFMPPAAAQTAMPSTSNAAEAATTESSSSSPDGEVRVGISWRRSITAASIQPSR